MVRLGVPVRVCGLFRRVPHTSCAPRAQNVYPVEKSCLPAEPNRSHPWLSILSGGVKRCGRHRNRRRRLFRSSFQYSPSGGLKLGTVNAQGLQWNLVAHASKLKALIVTAQTHAFDAVLVSDLHFHDLQVHIVYVEQFCLICRGAVGVLLCNNLAQQWEYGGRKLFAHDQSDRVLGVGLTVHGRSLALVANYTPAGGSVGLKRDHYDQAWQLSTSISSQSYEQFWGGDWNGHISGFETDLRHVGNFGLCTPTTSGGRVLKEFLVRSSLRHVDSHRRFPCRGTWRHNQTKAWYELDSFAVSESLFSSVQRRMFTFSLQGVSDHMGKGLRLQLGSLQARATRLKRRSYWQALQQKQWRSRNGLRRKCHHSILQGATADAAALRQDYASLVTQKLAAKGLSCSTPVVFDVSCEGWEESRSDVMHVYTDGSAEGSSSTAGWGVVLWHRNHTREACGPVVVDENLPLFLGAERTSNNTGELSAVMHSFLMLLSLPEDTCPKHVVFHYDSEYAANVAQAQWSLRRNVALARYAQKLLCQVQARCVVHWKWIKGHTGNIGNERADALAARGRSGESVPFPCEGAVLDAPDAVGPRRRCAGKTSIRATAPAVTQVPPPDVSWDELADVLTGAIDSLSGAVVDTRRGAPLAPSDKHRLSFLDQHVADSWEAVRKVQGSSEEPAALQSWRLSKRRRKDFLRKARSRYVQHVVSSLNDALNKHDWSRFYAQLRRLGLSFDGMDFTGSAPFSLTQIREHNLNVSANSKSVDFAVIDRAAPQLPTCHELGDLPTWPEFLTALNGVKESSPGKDGVSANMLKFGGPLVHQQVYRTVCAMWSTPATEWAPGLKTGLGIPLFKSGNRDDLDNYRTIVLLPMISRVLGRLLSRRISEYAEKHGLYSQTQYGNRKHRSVQDALFTVRTTLELAAEVAHHPELSYDAAAQLVVLLFDIKKAFPSVNREAAFHLFRRHGFPSSLIQLLESLHAGTQYQVSTSAGLSDPYVLASGFREGCSTSPCLYTLFHDCAMREFAKRARRLSRAHPEFFVDLHSWGGRPLNRRMNKHQIPSLPKVLQSGHDLTPVSLLDVTFADDTSLLCREAGRSQLEDLLTNTLHEFGETIKAGKTKRLKVARGDVDPHFVPSARLLGGWLSYAADYVVEDSKRLVAAKQLWCRLSRQLPRFGLGPKILGQLIYAGVLRALLFGTESRCVSGKTIRKWQCFLNGIARFACRQKLRTMQEDHVTQQDLSNQLGLKKIATYVGSGQLAYLGHLVRLPEGRIEKQMLFSWLPREAMFASFKGAISSRQTFWKRLRELLALSDLPEAQWQDGWVALAQKQGGVVWNALIRKWVRWQESLAQHDTWNARHTDAARLGRQQAAYDRAFQELGVHRLPCGRYKCGYEGCSIVQTLQGMRQHTVVCKNLSVAQRQTRSEAAAASAPAAPSRPADAARVEPLDLAPTGPRTRLLSKQARPVAFEKTACQATVHDVTACTSFDIKATLDHYASQHMTRRYHGAQLQRAITLTDLPPPHTDASLHSNQCRFCWKHLKSGSERVKHSRCCQAMPYDGWLFRVRVTLLPQTPRTFPCTHCGTQFSVPKAAGRHSVECGKRRQRQNLPLNLKQWHDLPQEPTC